eukprot:TRINITY_DN48196_c0_g1_i1.p1 TRINITY_DN48196_c0_g1~~TRINITY_DN48196_c0_g1_i1.p1  ORF type:complete len:261 (-),score=66.53 TRINITY_DN48196_c0_g1_i1:72-854(-)
MSSIGTGYDLSAGTFSPEGRVFQVEYASKAVEKNGTVIGIRTKTAVVFAVEKIIQSKMLEKSSNKQIFTVAPHVGAAIGGVRPDARKIINKARSEAKDYKAMYGHDVPIRILNQRVSNFVHMYTLGGYGRPFGVSTILGGWDKKGPQLYMIEPSGVSWGYYGCAVGKAAQSAKSEIEKLDLENLSAQEAVIEAAKIIYMVHDDIKDKLFELELSWICEETGFKHRVVPNDLRENAINAANEAIDVGNSDDEDDMENSDDE